MYKKMSISKMLDTIRYDHIFTKVDDEVKIKIVFVDKSFQRFTRSIINPNEFEELKKELGIKVNDEISYQLYIAWSNNQEWYIVSSNVIILKLIEQIIKGLDCLEDELLYQASLFIQEILKDRITLMDEEVNFYEE